MRSIASVAIITAVSKPKVWSVPLMSLSMVLGTPTLGTPFSLRNKRHRLRVVAAQRYQRIDLVGLQNLLHFVDAAGNLFHVGARRVQNGAAPQLNAVGAFEGQRNPIVVEHAAPAVQKADKLIAIVLIPFFTAA